MKRLWMVGTIVLFAALAAQATVVDSWDGPSRIWGLTWDGANLWAGQDSVATGTAQLMKLDPEDGSVLEQFSIPGQQLRGLGWDGTNLWVYSYRTGNNNVDKIYKVDPADGTLLDSLTTPFTENNYVGGMTFYNGFLYISRYYPDSPTLIHKVDPATGQSVGTITSPHAQPEGMAHDENSLWMVGDYFNDEDCNLYQLDPDSGTVLHQEYPLGPEINTTRLLGLTFDGEYFWLVTYPSAGASIRTVYKLQVEGVSFPEVQFSEEYLQFIYDSEAMQFSFDQLEVTNTGSVPVNMSLESFSLNSTTFGPDMLIADLPADLEPDQSDTLTFDGTADLATWIAEQATDSFEGEIVFNLDESGGSQVALPLYCTVLGVGEDRSVLPKHFALNTPYPNPFNATTIIRYTLPKASQVQISVVDVLGRRIALLDQQRRSAGPHEVAWNSTSSGGTPVASGTYFIRMEAGDFQAVRRVQLVK